MFFEGILNPYGDRPKFDNHRTELDYHLLKFFNEDEIKILFNPIEFEFRVDVIIIDRPEFDFNILITSGMSVLEMTNAAGIPDWDQHKFAEIVCVVPEIINSESLQPEGKFNWVANMLRQTALFPHYEKTWLGIGHSVQANMQGEPYSSDTEFMGGVFLPSLYFESNFLIIPAGPNIINLFTFFPLYREELDFLIQNGYNEFIDLLIAIGQGAMFIPERNNMLS